MPPSRAGRVLLAITATIAVSRTAPAQQALAVRTVQPAAGDVTRTLKIAGEVRPFEEIVLRSKVTGFIASIPVDRGSEVAKDDLLARLFIPEDAQQLKILEKRVKTAELSAAIADARLQEARTTTAAERARQGAEKARKKAAEVSEQLARVTRDRVRKLHAEGAATQQALDEAETAWSRAQADLANADAAIAVAGARVDNAQKAALRAARELDLSRELVTIAKSVVERQRTMMAYGELRAPFPGVVVERMVHTGDLVLGGASSSSPTPILRLCRSGKMRVVVAVPEAEVPFVVPGVRARVEGSTIRGAPIAASVTVAARALSRNRLMAVEIHVADPRLVPGAGVYVTLDVETHAGVLTVPSQTLLYRKKQAFVWTVENGVARLKPVTVGFNDLVRAEVQGLAPDAVVVVGSREGLKDGRPLTTLDGTDKSR